MSETRHFITTQDWPVASLESLLTAASALKARRWEPSLKGRSIALVFFNPSLRTRTSFEIGAWQMGMHAVVLQPGQGAWPIEFQDNVIMDGDAEEHVAEAARVLSRYVDLIAVRAFPKFKDWSVDRQDSVIRQFARYATVPIINLETITHPCQELAHILALRERLGGLRKKKYVLTWTWHPKPLNTAVANSAAMIATRFGMDVTLLCPNEHYLLDERYMQAARDNAKESAGSFTISHNIEHAYRDAEIIYAKSWGSLPFYGRWDQEQPPRENHKHFIVDEAKMALTNNAVFSHCLPARRNVKVTDGVIDSPQSLVIEEAENRLHVQKAIMCELLGETHNDAEGGR
ncbi:MAG: N-acetylornithine carbamoyltransferase [Phycisphaerales bacterium]